jgi:hypothetical protein
MASAFFVAEAKSPDQPKLYDHIPQAIGKMYAGLKILE